MAKPENVQRLTPEQERELCRCLIGAAPTTMSMTDYRHWTTKPRKLSEALTATLLRNGSGSVGDGQEVEVWQRFYADFLGLSVDLSSVAVPVDPDGFERVLYIAEDLTVNRVMAACKARFPTWQWTDDLDCATSHNDRDPKNGSYAIRVRDRVEADEELKGQSAEQVWQQKITGITVLERVLYELKYFAETGRHLDISNLTICTGSRYASGGVPYADWLGGGFRVGCVGPRDALVNWRARAVVTL